MWGFDNPRSLGKYETGSKAALPIFKDFVKNALYEEDFKNFSIPSNIYFAPINYDTGKIDNFANKKTIIESFKPQDMNSLKNNALDNSVSYDKLIKFRQFY